MKRALTIWMLVVSLAFQPLMFEGMCRAQESGGTGSGSASEDTAEGQAQQVDKARQEFDKAYKEIMAVEEVKKIGGFKGFCLKLFGKKDDINKKIDEANQEIKKAKEEMTKIREDVTKSSADAKKAALDSSKAAMAKQLELASQVKQKIADSMKKIAETVKKISEGLKKLGKTLGVIGAGITPIPYVGQVVGPILMKVGTVVGKIGAVMGVVGKGLELYAQKAELSAKDFANLMNEAKNAWKNAPDYNKNPPAKGGKTGGSGGGSQASVGQPDVTNPPIEGVGDGPVTGSGEGAGSTPTGEGSGVVTDTPTQATDDEEGGVPGSGGTSSGNSSSGNSQSSYASPGKPKELTGSQNDGQDLEPRAIKHYQGWLDTVAEARGWGRVSQNGKMDSRTVETIKKFQSYYVIPVTGKLDPQTIEILGNASQNILMNTEGMTKAEQESLNTGAMKVVKETRTFMSDNSKLTMLGAYWHSLLGQRLPELCKELEAESNPANGMLDAARIQKLITEIEKIKKEIIRKREEVSVGAGAAADILIQVKTAGDITIRTLGKAVPGLQQAYFGLSEGLPILIHEGDWRKALVNSTAAVLAETVGGFDTKGITQQVLKDVTAALIKSQARIYSRVGEIKAKNPEEFKRQSDAILRDERQKVINEVFTGTLLTPLRNSPAETKVQELVKGFVEEFYTSKISGFLDNITSNFPK